MAHVLIALGTTIFFALLVRIKSGFGFSLILVPVRSFSSVSVRR